ncbi:MAG: Fe-S cluster assembly protein SufB [Armatimonadetes bacterium]|nr:Fe-S cluster assembly protein SufB [Armatimonadota bacterium]
MATTSPLGIDLDHYKWGFHDPEKYVFKARKGLDREIVEMISHMKNEPEWMRAIRLHSLEHFFKRPTPKWGADLDQIDFNDIYYYLKPTDGKGRTWDDVPADIKRTFDRLGIPEAEKKFLAGVGAQYESESVYHNLKEEWEKLGVIFLDTDSALREHPDIVQEYFGTVVPPEDNKLAALNTAVWSGGSFVYVPAGVKVDIPLQAYFRINAEKAGQFERTMIICEPGSYVHYVEGCLPPGELVSKGDGWVNIESICPGDTVMDSNGNRAVVKSVRVRPFKGIMLTIRPISRGNAFQLTPEHPVMAVKRCDVAVKRRPRKNWRIEVDTQRLIAGAARFIPAGQLEVGDFLVFPISKLTRENPRYTPTVMRLLGYYLAEGSAYVHNRLKQPVVSFTFNESERGHIDEVKALIEKFTGKNSMEIRQASRHGIEVRVYSRELMEVCVTECGKGASEKQLSSAIMALPPAVQAHLLETYFKGDGSVYARRKHLMMRATTVSPQLAWQLQELLARQGHYATIGVRKGGKDTIRGREITRRDQYILYYSPDKQQSEVRRGDGCFFVPVKEISQTPYEGPVFNFELMTTPNAYVTRGFAVHNCTAPIYTTDSLHSAVVEIIVKEGARCRYTTIQNWSTNTYNLVTKRAVAYRDATMEWVDGNLGSKITMKYPSVYMVEPGAKAEILSVAFAGKGQHQDPGGKVIHAAPHTQSSVVSKSIAKDGGRAGYRGLVKVYSGAKGSRCAVRCDALILDERSRSDTYPYMEIDEQDISITHEATVSKVSDEQLFYLMSRGIRADEAMNMIVRGFIEPIVKELPLEYAVELNRLIALEMEGSVG